MNFSPGLEGNVGGAERNFDVFSSSFGAVFEIIITIKRAKFGKLLGERERKKSINVGFLYIWIQVRAYKYTRAGMHIYVLRCTR